MKRALSIWFPNWPIQRIVQALREPKAPSVNQPHRRQAGNSGHSRAEPPGLILYAAVRGGHRVVACSPQAARQGITLDMPVAEATSIAQATSDTDWRGQRPGASALKSPPALKLIEHDPLADRLALEELAAWCEQFSPVVGLEDAPQPDTLLLDVTGLETLFGGEDLLAQQVERALQQRGFTARIAIADSLGAAWAVAHAAQAPTASPEPVIVPPGQAAAALRPLQIEALRLPQETLRLLHELGLDEIGQLMALPRAGLATRLGPLLVQRLAQALGETEEVIAAHHPPVEIEANWLLEHATDRQEMVHFALQHLIERVADQLYQRQQGALQLKCRLDYQDRQSVEVPLGLFRPSASARHLWELVRLRLENLRLAAPVEALEVQVLRTVPLETHQQELFAQGHAPNRQRQLAMLIDRLSSRLAREAVLRPSLMPDAQPEFAYRYRVLTGLPSKARASRERQPRKTLPGPGERPLWLHARPVPLEVMSVAPDGPPFRFHFKGEQHDIAYTWGPERIETGWWRSAYVRRDYYRVETRSGARFWLFRRLTDRTWFLQGEYE